MLRRTRHTRLIGALLLLCLLLASAVEFVLAGRDFYKILGVKRDANERQLKKAYHKLSMKYHPDKNKSEDAQKKFIEINNAYEVLSDKKTRDIYDQFGEEGLKNGGAGGPPPGHQQGSGGGSGGASGFQWSTGGGGGSGMGGGFQFSDPMNLFAQFFGGGGGGSGMGAGTRSSFGTRGMGGSGGGMPGMGGMGGMPGMGQQSSGPSKVISLTSSRPGPLKSGKDEKSKKMAASEDWLVAYISPQCGHCQRLLPEYEKAATQLTGLVKVAKVDCTQEQDLCSKAGIRGYPTIKVFKAGEHGKPLEYQQERTAKAIHQYAVNLLPTKYVHHISPLNAQGLAKVLAKDASTGKATIVFVAPRLSPAYKVLSRTYDKYLKLSLALITDEKKRTEFLKSALGGVKSSDGKHALLIIYTDAEGKETSREEYAGRFKMKDLDAFLYKHAMKIKKAGGGVKTDAGAGKQSASSASSKSDSTVSALTAASFEKLTTTKQSGFTLLVFPSVSSNTAQTQKLYAALERTATKFSRDQKFKFVWCGASSSADVKNAPKSDASVVARAKALFSVAQKHAHSMLVAVRGGAGGTRYASFDLAAGAKDLHHPVEDYLNLVLEDLLSGNVKFQKLRLEPEHDEL